MQSSSTVWLQHLRSCKDPSIVCGVRQEEGAAAELEEAEGAFSEDEEEEQEQSEDEDRHQRMLADVSAAVAGSGPRGASRRRATTLLNEVYPESEYNLQPAVASAGKPQT